MSIPVGPPWGFGGSQAGSGLGGAAVPSPLSEAAAGSPVTRALQIYLPEIQPIPDAQNFNPAGQKNSVGVEANVAIPGCTITLPANALGVVRGVSLYLDNMLTTTNVQFSLVVNGGAPAGFGNLSMFPRAAPFVGNTFDCLIRLPAGATVSIIYSNVDGGTYLVGASFSGWYWAQASGDRWANGG